ncbi:MAG: alpha-E domain-containing protein [Clostridiales bacterium]|nr:alpha-E domain-containing protein [Clostridiales bacterium]
MGIKSIEVTDRLYWLGRYSERVYTSLRLFAKSYDDMLDKGDTYGELCRSLEIPNIYPTAQNFLRRYPFDESDPNSIASNLRRAYDNAVELRQEIGTEELSYIQLAVYEMNRARLSDAPMLEFQKIADNILAFWGIIDDQVEDENTRNIIKVGKRVERIDLFGRLHASQVDLHREVRRLQGRIDRCTIRYDRACLAELGRLVEAEPLDYSGIVQTVERLTAV